jgi:hypothetical protein
LSQSTTPEHWSELLKPQRSGQDTWNALLFYS